LTSIVPKKNANKKIYEKRMMMAKQEKNTLFFDPNQEFKKGDKQAAAYNYIKQAIISNVFEPQQQLFEKDLSAALGGMSRTPIRDALRRLTFEGFTENIPGRGVFVTQVSFIDLLEISELRLPLEETAVRLFIERADNDMKNELNDAVKKHEEYYLAKENMKAVEYDNEFHKIIARGTMNKRLYNTISQLITDSARGAYLTIKDSNRIKTSIEQHKKLFKYINDEDTEKAVSAVKEHINGWIQYIKDIQMNKFFLFNR
jgi:DNA-binding GntR family transcriptional regulator